MTLLFNKRNKRRLDSQLKGLCDLLDLHSDVGVELELHDGDSFDIHIDENSALRARRTLYEPCERLALLLRGAEHYTYNINLISKGQTVGEIHKLIKLGVDTELYEYYPPERIYYPKTSYTLKWTHPNVKGPWREPFLQWIEHDVPVNFNYIWNLHADKLYTLDKAKDEMWRDNIDKRLEARQLKHLKNDWNFT